LRACIGAVQSEEDTGSQQSHSSWKLGKPVAQAEMSTAKGTNQTNLQISQNKEKNNSLKYG